MSHLSIENLEREERLIKEANDAEIQQHWYQASILWRKLGETISADLCESILQYLAENNLNIIRHCYVNTMSRGRNVNG